jgi:Cu/Ag efflux protein CusF
MKSSILITSIVTAFALPASILAQDKQDPGKSGDAVKNPPAKEPSRPAEPARTPNAAERNEPGKSSDAVKEQSPTAQRHFKGEITKIDRAAKTITINDQTLGSHTLHIGDTTKLKHGDKSASWDELKVGATVDGTCRGGAEKAHAETLNIGK